MTIAVLIAAQALEAPLPSIDTTTQAPAARTARAQINAAALAWPAKDPDETLDYGNDLSQRIADVGDSITTTEATVVEGTGLSVVAHYLNALAPQTTTTWLMGGTPGETARVQIRTVTVRGRRLDQTISLPIAAR
jgi:hypothetical protein